MPENSEQSYGDGLPGLGVDAYGGQVVDPTANVIALVRAESKRLDDLVAASTRRQDDLRTMESKHQTEKDDLRSHFYESLRAAETARIDAIRAVDVGAVAAAANVSATQATTLANTVASSAEALRNQVASAAQAQSVALAAALDPIQKDIADLRRAQYEAQGQKTADPADAKMDILLERLGRIENVSAGRLEQKTESRQQVSATSAVVGIVVALLAAATLYFGFGQQTPTVVQIPTQTTQTTP